MTSKQPLVSVIVPAYNHENFVLDSINSIIDQDYPYVELIVINDGSKDNTHSMIEKITPLCKSRFVRFEYVNQENQGLSKTLNQGVLWSQGEFITVLASDDIMKPYKISFLLSALRKSSNDVGLAYGDAEFINNEGCKINLDNEGNPCSISDGWGSFIQFYIRKRSNIKIGINTFDYSELLKGNFLPAMSVMWRKDVLVKVGMFTPNIMIEDWDLWLRMAKETKAIYVDSILASYRWHQNNTVKTQLAKLREGQDFILKRELDFFVDNAVMSKKISKLLLINAIKLMISGKYKLACIRFFDINLWKKVL